MGATLMLGHSQPRGIPCFCERTGVVVDGQTQVIAERRTWNPLRLVLVKDAAPMPRKFCLRGCGRRDGQ